MYVTPSTAIHILKNIPLNKSYENTVYYANADVQRDAFLKYNKFTLTDYSYQRTQLGTIRVSLAYEQLYDCDYLMFQNTAFGAKWFYAFITGVAYISNEVSEIYYELDVMQTWAYDYKFLPSFVERRHAANDAMFANTQPEGLELGNVYNTVKSQNYGFNTYYNLIFSAGNKINASFSGISVSPPGTTVNSIYNGLWYYRTINANDPNSMINVINAIVNQGLEDAVVAFYQSASGGRHTSTQVSFSPDSTPYGFTPKNNKLFIYPFMKYTVTQNRGIAKDFKPERWARLNGNITGDIHCAAFPEAEARFQPINYNDGNTAIDNAVNYASFPTCAFAGNSFAVWWAQNKNNYIASMNAIGNSYDTNVQIAQNNYQMAARSANASAIMQGRTTDTALANATAANNTALANNQRSSNAGIVEGMIGGVGNALGLNFGGAVNSMMGMVNTTINSINKQDTINTSQMNSEATAAAAMQNTGLALSTALKNASTAQASATLSALTAKQNATAQMVAKKQDIQNLPPTAKGNAAGDGLAFSSNPGFTILQCTIKDEYAKIIDDYFSVYGYAQNCLYTAAQLNQRIDRKHFTYTKTVGCAITGDLNSNDQIAIQAIYDNGIQTWDTLENVGHYDMENGTL